jgi:uncharacterized membrane protein
MEIFLDNHIHRGYFLSRLKLRLPCNRFPDLSGLPNQDKARSTVCSNSVSTMKGTTMSDPNPSGLSDNAVGAIAYLTPVPAVAFLVLVPYKKSSYVRFHAWQSIFLTLAAVIVSYLLDFLFEFGGIVGARLFVPLTWIVLLFWLLVWILCVFKALSGKRFKLPIVGGLADRQAEG